MSADGKSNIREFVKAICARWFTAMSGPLSVPLVFLGFYVENTTAKILFFVLAAFGLVFSSYWIWKTERDKVTAAHKEIQRLSAIAPELDATIDGIVHGGYSDQFPGMASAFLFATITNTGSMQSIANDFRLIVRRNGISRDVTLRAFANTVTLGFPIPGQPGREQFVRYQNSEALYRKASNPIQVGSSIQGMLFVMVDAADREWLSPGSEFILQFKDVKGRRYETKNILNDVHSEPKDFAGMTGELVV